MWSQHRLQRDRVVCLVVGSRTKKDEGREEADDKWDLRQWREGEQHGHFGTYENTESLYMSLRNP